jgi:hypothetical protein
MTDIGSWVSVRVGASNDRRQDFKCRVFEVVFFYNWIEANSDP